MARSPQLLVALLAVMKCGAAYVPLDARLPSARVSLILQSTEAAVVIVDPARASAVLGCECIIASEGATWPDDTGYALPEVDGDDIAYIIFTSGSTGEPKGVVVDHAGLANYLSWAHGTFSAGGPVSMPLYSSIGFDLTVTSIFVPLLSGGEVVVYPDPDHGADLSVLQVFDDDAVDIVKLTPAHLSLVADQRRDLERIRCLVLGGEDLKTSLTTRAVAALGGEVRVFNEYGPTEAIVGCMSHCFDAREDTGVSIPIGRPASGITIYLLDSGLNSVPVGATGEIYIGGERIARGYFRDPQLSAERFLPDPFHPGGRMYRSGDRARFRDPLTLEYLGREDDQVKIRGVRVELAEVEHALATYPQIDAVAVKVIETRAPIAPQVEHHCTQCGLASDYPGVRFDNAGVCSVCQGLENYHEAAQTYFKPMSELETILAAARKRVESQSTERSESANQSRFDCAMLFSGGKDSAYALYRLAALGPRILALTLDNGFISETAKQNIQRITSALGVEHRYMSTPAMNDIFVDSLERHSNVCNGCFKTIYTLATNLALREGIPIVVTGLSRGQFFETRLTPELFERENVTCTQIDDTVLQARKAYHRVNDAVSELLDVTAFENDEVFDTVRFVDFYRYCDVSLTQIYDFLQQQASWVRPMDTGRSTNCLINNVGIYVHRKREGYHNYALPYSWDVRMGHKTREAAIEELDDDIDVGEVHRILEQIGFDLDDAIPAVGERRLAAYLGAPVPVDVSQLRMFLAQRLPEALIPSHFVTMDALPLTVNGKIDRDALPPPRPGRAALSVRYRTPRSESERTLERIWSQVLCAERVGIDDNFYDLGGDSISAIQIAARAHAHGLHFAAVDLFAHQSVAQLAAFIDDHASGNTPALPEAETGAFSMAPSASGDLDTIAALLSRPSDPNRD